MSPLLQDKYGGNVLKKVTQPTVQKVHKKCTLSIWIMDHERILLSHGKYMTLWTTQRRKRQECSTEPDSQVVPGWPAFLLLNQPESILPDTCALKYRSSMGNFLC